MSPTGGRRAGAAGVFVIVAVLAGCRPAAAPGSGTGAKDAALAFENAIVVKDWARAYAVLAPESKARTGADQFAQLAQQYRARLGFEPATAHVLACEEHGAEAVAHVSLTGNGPHRGRFKDDLQLLRTGDAWGIILSANFGRNS